MSDDQIPDAVVAWFRSHIDEIDGDLTFTRIAGGRSNLTFRVTDDAGHAWALRRPPLGGVLETAHDMGREWRFLAALNPTDVPVPTPRAFCDDYDVWGADLYVMDFAAGKVLNDTESGAAVPEKARTNVGTSTVDVLAALHAVEPAAVGLDDLARPGNFVERQLKRWHRQAHSSAMEDLSALDATHDALAARVPEGEVGIVHGDFRPGNIAYDPDGHAVAVFDWELATIGDPLCDLGHLLVSWSEPGDTVAEALSSPTPAGGYPTRGELIERYTAARGLGDVDIAYYLAFARWRAACIHAGVWTRYRAGDMGADADPDEVTGPPAIIEQAETALAELEGR
ncbi:acyl-CoA dehydrogenase [Actinomycetospora sp. NBRC 106375]|uniref:phosphotransferase family protein n=1 Tax=Actinomycetospora sp. NBRC 106375 TaxID=3032207 RepID=UPI0024A13969|nr:phosphotransferase family protein [Actinomycetospora sp. NBRC 106375]GLZ47042.1 acyl-CoA dehydrogenase [Actinomycetospora sp. NBRC 106375]